MVSKVEQIRALREAQATERQRSTEPWRFTETLANAAPVIQSVSHEVAVALEQLKSESRPSYRYRDPDKRRAYMRDLMRRKRAQA